MTTSPPMDADPARRGRPGPGFTDRLIQPFVVSALSAVTIAQVSVSPPAHPGLALGILIPVILLAAVSVLPWPRTLPWSRVALLGAYGVLAALLFPLLPGTTAVGFAFLATGIAGERLASRRAAVGVALLTAGVATAAVLASGSSAAGPPWWLAPAIALPVYVGIARRSQRQNLSGTRAALAVTERARASEAREAALLERGRIASEMHDVLGHALSGIALQLEMADALHEAARDDEANRAVLRARSMAVAGIAETRRAVHALNEDPEPLLDALRTMTANFAAGLQATGEPGAVGVRSAQAIIRTAQEGLTNAQRHAHGAAVALTLDFRPDTVELRIVNARASAPVDARPRAGAGLGLAGMRERITLIGGTLAAGPTEDGGWSVAVAVPR